MRYIYDILEDLPENIKAAIFNLEHNYRYGMLQISSEEIRREIIGYLNGLYDCGLILPQDRETIFDYCVGKYNN